MTASLARSASSWLRLTFLDLRDASSNAGTYVGASLDKGALALAAFRQLSRGYEPAVAAVGRYRRHGRRLASCSSVDAKPWVAPRLRLVFGDVVACQWAIPLTAIPLFRPGPIIVAGSHREHPAFEI